VIATLWGISAGGWTALAAVCAFVLALPLAGVAVWQAGEARRLRLEQAQPYVAIFAEPSPAASWVYEVVIKNFGRTPATNIRVRVAPELRRSGKARGAGERVDLPDVIPTLVPGQEWRTLWDSQIDRADAQLADSHTARVSFRDAAGKREFEFEFGIDFEVVARRDVVDVLGLHDVAKALGSISETLKTWKP
jgi:hypothetical protein